MRTVTSSLRPIAAAAACGLALAAAAVPAHAAGPGSGESRAGAAMSVSVADPAGDVDTTAPDDWFVPDIDIRKVAASFQKAHNKVRVVVTFADVKGLRHVDTMYEHHIRVINYSGAEYQGFDLRRSPWAQGTTADFYIGEASGECTDASWNVNTTADTVAMSIPLDCLERTGKKAIKLSVESTGMYSYMNGEKLLGYDGSKKTALLRVAK